MGTDMVEGLVHVRGSCPGLTAIILQGIFRAFTMEMKPYLN